MDPNALAIRPRTIQNDEMQQTHAQALHICSEIKRLIENEFPHITLVFIAEKKHNLQGAYNVKKNEIQQHGARDEALNHLNQIFSYTLPELPYCTHPFKSMDSHVIPMLAKESLLLCLIIDLELYKNQAQFKNLIFRTLYKPLSQIVIKDEKNAYSPEKINMLEDCFGIILTALQTQNTVAYFYAQDQCKKLLRATPGHEAETKPFPIALDAVQIILNETSQNNHIHASPAFHALNMTAEIADTMSEDLIQKWVRFARKAQYLAWANHKEEDILSMAIYASEDSQIRAIANIVADTLKISPPLKTYFDLYNPFTAFEANERHHISLCKQAEKLAFNALKQQDIQSVETTIRTMNKNLATGRCMGWCATNLRQLLKEFKLFLEDNTSPQDFHKNFPFWKKEQETNLENQSQQLSWKDLKELSMNMFKQRRDGHLFTGNSLLYLIKKKHPSLYPIFESICLMYQDELIHDPQKEAEKKYQEEFGGLTLEENPQIPASTQSDTINADQQTGQHS